MKYVPTMTARLLGVLVFALGVGAAWHSAAAQSAGLPGPEADSGLIENPIIRERFSSDPAALDYGGRVWLYTGHDEAGPDADFFEMHDWQLYSSDDLVEWKHHGSPISAETFAWARGDAWASQVIERDGKFYFYATVRHDDTKPGFAIGVAVADRPEGPFVDARGSALISNDMTDAPIVNGREMDWDDLDPTVFVDDGQVYLFWGNTVPRYARLADNMTELAGPIVDLDLPHFTEAPWLHKYDGTYYLSYAYGYPEQIAYATADEITGPYVFQGVINDTIPNSPTNHQSVVAFNGDWYFFYHNAALPGGGEYRRSVAVERLFYDDEGRIHPITQTAGGLGTERPEGDAVFLASRAASSQADEPEYVINPVAPRVADPWVYKHTDGYYYLIGSVPAYDRIDVRRAETLQGLAFAEPATVWRKHDEGPMSRHIWAPELHYVDGTWVIHFAAGREEEPFGIRMYALTTDAENPIEGEWTERGQVTTNWDSFSLDATTFEHRGTRYLVWAQHDPEIGGNTNLYIAEMDSPWSITGEQVLITRPEYDWEVQGYRVNEGPAVLKKNGRIWMTYSASATDANYAMGLLWADEDADLLDAASWAKSPEPVMTTNAENGVFGPGHNSFTVSKDGAYDILVYHARPCGNIRGNSLYDPNRQTRMQVLRWAKDGTPSFGKPVPDGPHVFAEPSDE